MGLSLLFHQRFTWHTYQGIVSLNLYVGFHTWGYPKWLVYKGKSHLEMDDDWGYPQYFFSCREDTDPERPPRGWLGQAPRSQSFRAGEGLRGIFLWDYWPMIIGLAPVSDLQKPSCNIYPFEKISIDNRNLLTCAFSFNHLVRIGKIITDNKFENHHPSNPQQPCVKWDHGDWLHCWC